MYELDTLLHELLSIGASDLHLKTFRTPIFRINKKLVPRKGEPMTPENMLQIKDQLLKTEYIQNTFKERLAADFSYTLGDQVARFRSNLFFSKGQLGVVFRHIPKVPSLYQMGLPTVLMSIAERKQGMNLVTGPAGVGKSTTLAAVLNHINTTKNIHLITVEDPVEFMFEDDKAEVTQREIGIDTPSWKHALKDILRQDPDVLLIGESRDKDTISTLITAAETGHLVFSTLHTRGAPQSIIRILDMFEPSSKNQVRLQLADCLHAIISQRLVKLIEPGQTACLEILINTPTIAKLIEQEELGQIREQMEKSAGYYRMQSMNQSLVALILNGMVDEEVAKKMSDSPKELEVILRTQRAILAGETFGIF
jgi:twitching motility protein PilT